MIQGFRCRNQYSSCVWQAQKCHRYFDDGIYFAATTCGVNHTTRLDLRDCNASAVSLYAFQNLEKVVIRGSVFLPRQIAKLKFEVLNPEDVLHVDWSDMQLESISESFYSFLSRARNIKSICLRQNRLENVDKLLKYDQIQQLDVSRNEISAFPGYMPRSIQEVNLRDNKVGIISRPFLEWAIKKSECFNQSRRQSCNEF